MDTLFNYDAFVLMLTDDQHTTLINKIKSSNNIMDIVHEYKREDYWLVQLEVIDYHRSKKEVCRFLFASLDYLALKQNSSTFIIVKDKNEWARAIKKCYTKQTKYNFICDMLSIEDRYKIYNYLAKKLGVDTDLRLIYERDGSYYDLRFDDGCKFVFEPSLMAQICEDGESSNCDIFLLEEGLGLYKFHVGILK